MQQRNGLRITVMHFEIEWHGVVTLGHNLSFGDPPTKGLKDVMPVASIVESTNQEWKQQHVN